jgi:hypothetical protein
MTLKDDFHYRETIFIGKGKTSPVKGKCSPGKGRQDPSSFFHFPVKICALREEESCVHVTLASFSRSEKKIFSLPGEISSKILGKKALEKKAYWTKIWRNFVV